MTTISCCAVILSNNKSLNEVLVTKRHSPKPEEHGKWYFPGGKLDATHPETLEDCIRREMIEELGIFVEPLWVLHSHRYFLPDKIDLLVIPFACGLRSGKPKIAPLSGNSEWRWVTNSQFQTLDLAFPTITPLIMEDFLAWLRQL